MALEQEKKHNDRNPADGKKTGSASKGKKSKQSIGNKVFYIVTQALLCAILFFTLGKIGERTYAYIDENEANKGVMENAGIDFSTPAPSQATAAPGTGGTVAAVTPKPVPSYPMATPQRYTYPEGNITVETLKSLKAQNSDFKFWMYIPDTPINYYVMQSDDLEYYLHRNIEKKYVYSGSLFLDFRNDASTLDGHTIVYGHNMGDGSMFNGLLKYYIGGDDSYLKSHQYMYTYSEQGVGIWQIFSVYETTTDEYYIETYFNSDDEYYEFIKDLQNKADYRTEVLLRPDSDVMTLSTCFKRNSEKGRLVVNAVRLATSILPEY